MVVIVRSNNAKGRTNANSCAIAGFFFEAAHYGPNKTQGLTRKSVFVDRSINVVTHHLVFGRPVDDQNFGNNENATSEDQSRDAKSFQPENAATRTTGLA